MDPEEDEPMTSRASRPTRSEAGTVREHRNAAGAGREQSPGEHGLPLAETDGDETMARCDHGHRHRRSPGHDPRTVTKAVSKIGMDRSRTE